MFGKNLDLANSFHGAICVLGCLKVLPADPARTCKTADGEDGVRGCSTHDNQLQASEPAGKPQGRGFRAAHGAAYTAYAPGFTGAADVGQHDPLSTRRALGIDQPLGHRAPRCEFRTTMQCACACARVRMRLRVRGRGVLDAAGVVAPDAAAHAHW